MFQHVCVDVHGTCKPNENKQPKTRWSNMKPVFVRLCNTYVLAQREPTVALLHAHGTPDSAPEAGGLMWLMSQGKA